MGGSCWWGPGAPKVRASPGRKVVPGVGRWHRILGVIPPPPIPVRDPHIHGDTDAALGVTEASHEKGFWLKNHQEALFVPFSARIPKLEGVPPLSPAQIWGLRYGICVSSCYPIWDNLRHCGGWGGSTGGTHRAFSLCIRDPPGGGGQGMTPPSPHLPRFSFTSIRRGRWGRR